MKKKIGLIILSALSFCSISGTAVCNTNANNHQRIIAIYAKEKFEQKTYVYEGEQGKATLILLSETEFSITIGEETKYGTYVKNENILTLTIGDSSIDVEINEVMGTFGELKEQEPVDVVDEVKEWFDKFFSPQMVAMYMSWLAYIGTIIGLVTNIKKLKQSNNLTLKNVSDEVKKVLAETISKEVAEKFDTILPNMQSTQEKTNQIMSIFAKILALSQENTPESRVAILNLIEELGVVSKEVVDNAKDIVKTGKELAEKTKDELDHKIDEIVESYDGTSI